MKNNKIKATSSVDMKSRTVKLSLIAASILSIGSHAYAGSTTIGEDINVDYVVTANYAVGVRVENQSPALLGQINADDSDRSFKRGSLVNNRVGVTAQADFKKGDFGFFIGGSAFYDDVYRSRNDNDSQATLNRAGAANEFSDQTRFYNGQRARLLDTFVYGSWQLAEDKKLSLKAGNHLVAWGENIFFPGISGGQSRADATKANIAGVETKDVLLPTGQVSGQLAVNNQLSLLGYVQYKFKPTELQPNGDYLFPTDVVGPGAQKLFFSPTFSINRTPDVRAKDTGQWGIGTRYRIDPSLEIGAYHINYAPKVPSVVFDTSGAVPTYHVQYFDNVRATALSFTTRAGDSSIGGEIAYHDGLPVQVNTGALPAMIRGRALQAQLNIFSSYGPNPISDQLMLLGEVVGQRLLNLESNPYGATARDSDLASVTKSAWGYQIMAIPTWRNVFTGWDLATPIAWNQTVSGIGPIFQTGMINGGDKRVSLGATFTYLGNLEVAVKYNAFLGHSELDGYGRELRPLADRDFVTLNVKYSF